MNITDVDDRIIRDPAAEGGTLDELTAPHIARFLSRPGRAAHRPAGRAAAGDRAHPRDGALIARLLENGHAYRTDDGSIFFRIASWPAYGTLATARPERARVGERVAADDYGKDDVRDFALWKGRQAGRAELGRPRSGTAGRAGTSSARR